MKINKKAVTKAKKLARDNENRELCFKQGICYRCAGDLVPIKGVIRDSRYLFRLCPKCDSVEIAELAAKEKREQQEALEHEKVVYTSGRILKNFFSWGRT